MAQPTDGVHRLLERAAPLLRLPTAPDRPPEVLPDGTGLRCPATGRVYPCREGVLDVLTGDQAATTGQGLFLNSVLAWGYDRMRWVLLRVFRLPPFAQEVASIQEQLQVQPGDTLLDLACGQGNFTLEWARRAGPGGLVLALDFSPAMLARAAAHLRREGMANVLLIRGDAHHLPLADACLMKVNCSGGFHLFPDLPQALREISRVSSPGALLTAATFARAPDDRRERTKRWLEGRLAFHFVPLVGLGEQLAALGYRDYAWSLPGGWFGYTSARKG